MVKRLKDTIASVRLFINVLSLFMRVLQEGNMPPSERFIALLEVMKDIHIRKNAGYGGKDDPWKNFRMAVGFGVPASIGCLIRLSDKFARVQSLIADPANDKVGEAVTDTLIDLANYAIIAICLLEEEANGRQSST
jgi:hypothetical protein